MTTTPGPAPESDDPLLLIVEDDDAFARSLVRSFERRGYRVLRAASLDEVHTLLPAHQPEFAVVDLRLAGGASGLACVQALHEHDAETVIVVLTGYASIATTVDAIKLGATQYLAKPADVDAILKALNATDVVIADEEMAAGPMSVDRLEWEHIQRVLAENEGNISATARALKMHRRTLQRKLAKRPVKE